MLIATSTGDSDLTERATAAGKVVLGEKPVDLSLASAQACLKVAAARGKPEMIGFNRRVDTNFAAQRATADLGEVGEIALLSITLLDPARRLSARSRCEVVCSVTR